MPGITLLLALKKITIFHIEYIAYGLITTFGKSSRNKMNLPLATHV